MFCLCTFLFLPPFPPFSLSPLQGWWWTFSTAVLYSQRHLAHLKIKQSALSIQGIQLPGLLLLLKKTTAPISLLYKQDYNTKKIPKCKHVHLPFVTQNSKMQYTSLPSYIYLSPRRETRAKGCYCINIGKVKTRVMWRTRSSKRGTQERTLNAKLVLWYAIQPVCATNNTGAEWETMMTCQGLMRRGNISLVKRQRKSKRERAVEMWFEMYAQTKWKKKKHWGDYLTEV